MEIEEDMTTDIKELVKRLRDTYWSGAPYMRELLDKSADALEAMAGEVERLKDRDAINATCHFQAAEINKLETERDRLQLALSSLRSDNACMKAALEEIKTKAPKYSPEMDDDYGGNFDDAWSGGWDSGFNAAANIARKALDDEV